MTLEDALCPKVSKLSLTSYMYFSQDTRVWRAKALFNTNLKINTNFKKMILD